MERKANPVVVPKPRIDPNPKPKAEWVNVAEPDPVAVRRAEELAEHA